MADEVNKMDDIARSLQPPQLTGRMPVDGDVAPYTGLLGDVFRRQAGKVGDAGTIGSSGARKKAARAKKAREVTVGGSQVQTTAPRPAPSRQTVNDPITRAYPDIYLRPDELVARAKVAPEDPMMKRLFGVDRDDLYQLAQEGTRQGNIITPPFNIPAGSRGAAAAKNVMTRRNENRMVDIISEARKRPELFKGMASWYTMDPAFWRLSELVGPEEAARRYNSMNAFTAMSSPNSEVLTELNRGTGANWLHNQGLFGDFARKGGLAEEKRGAGFPEHLRGIQGHMAHSTAMVPAMEKFIAGGLTDLNMKSAKVPTYFGASGVPETGFQTRWPIGDAHWSRLVGLPDVRGFKRDKKTGLYIPNAASASVPEMSSLGPWWRERVAERAGLEAVPAQAVVWGAGSNATGVTSPVGASKLELLSHSIEKAAKRMGVSPETARDLILTGQAHAGFVDPALLSLLAGGGAAAAGLGGLFGGGAQQNMQ
jgi:hypothetical protein